MVIDKRGVDMSVQKNSDKQSLKSDRVKSYFIQAAKDIILSDGVENISVRKVADRAGYSYATIYNYFTDLNALLLDVKSAMIQDMMVLMSKSPSDKLYDLEAIKQINRQYASYYLEHPHVFRFFYSYRLTNEPDAKASLTYDFKAGWYETYRGFVINGTLKETEVEIVAKTTIYALHGLLALYFSNNGLTKEALFSDLDNSTEYLLKGRYQS